MRSFRFEIQKLLYSKVLLKFLLLVFTGLCLLYVYIERDSTVSFRSYRQVNSEMEGMDEEEMLLFLESEKSKIDSENITKGKYTDNNIFDKKFINEIEEEIKAATEYDEYLKKISDAAKIGLGHGPFAQKGFSKENLKKTQKAYEKLNGISLEYSAGRGVDEMLSFIPRVILELFIGFMIAVLSFAKEKEDGVLSLVRAQKDGRLKNILSRILAINCVIMIINFLVLSLSLFFSCCLFGFPKGNFLLLPVQSLKTFNSSALKINVLTFLALCWIFESMVCSVISMITVFLSVIIGKLQFVFLIIAAIGGVESLLYAKIGNFSRWVNLKHINIISFSKSSEVLGVYKNLNIGGNAVNYMALFMGVILVVWIILGLAICISYCTVYKEKSIDPGFLKTNRFSFLGRHISIFRHEGYKLLFSGKMLLVFVIFAGAMIISYKPAGRKNLLLSDAFFRDYVTELQGMGVDEESDKIIDNIEKEIKKNPDRAYNDERLEAFSELTDYRDYIAEKEDRVYVNGEGYERLFTDKKRNSINGIIAAFILVLVFSWLCTVDKQGKMNILIRSTAKGRKKTQIIKFAVAFLVCVFVFFMVYIRFLKSICAGYDLNMLDKSAYSLKSLSWVPGFLSVRMSLILIFAKYFVGLLMVYPICMFFARRVKSYSMTVMLSVSVVIVPLMFTYIGIPLSRYILLNLLLV